MSTIVTRTGKGSTLTHAEVDANFTNLNIDKLETAAIANMLETTDIGVSVQAHSANLDEYATVNPTAAGLALLDDADAAAQRTTLGVAINSDVMGYVAPSTSGNVLTSNGSAWTSAAPATTYIDVPTRQTVLSGPVDGNGYAAFLTTGSGLRPGLDASPTPVTVAFANGFGTQGAVDYVSVLSADGADPLGADLPANNLSYIYSTYSSPTAVTWAATLNPPQYGYAYDRTRQSLLRFAGTDGSTTILDDYGNTWTASGNAQIDTAVQIDGLNTLLLDGTGDYITSSSFSTLSSSDSWTIEFKVRFASFATAGVLLYAYNSSNFGVYLGKVAGAGTGLYLYLSGDGTSWNIASNLQGNKVSWATGTTYHIAITYDSVAGKYFTYVDGVLDEEITSSARVCGIATTRIGADTTGTLPLNGALAGFRFSPFCRYPNGTTFTAPDISTYAVEGNFFSIPEMKMYEITSASASAGTNPGMTQRNLVFVGEATTSGAAVSNVVSYAYRGEYMGQPVTVAVSTEATWNHNIGVDPDFISTEVLARAPNTVSKRTWLPAVNVGGHTMEGGSTTDADRRTITSRTRTDAAGIEINGVAFTAAPAQYKLIAKRRF